MALRNQWILLVVVLLMGAILAWMVLDGGASPIRFRPAPRGTQILRVPGQYGTIQSAIDAARPGDIVHVQPGTYNESLTLDKPISLTAASFDPARPASNGAVLDGRNSQAAILIPAGLAQMPSIRGFAIRNSRDGIEAHSPFIAEDNFFYGSQWAVEYQAGAGGINRDNVYFNTANDALHISDVTSALLVENNRFLYAGDDAIEIDLMQGSAAFAVEISIWNNMLIGSSQDGIKFVDHGSGVADANRRFTIAGNLLANNRRAGIGFMHTGNTNEDYSGVDAGEAVRLYNNTFYGNDYGISGGDNMVAFNNIMASMTSRAAWRVQGGMGANSVIAYTLFWQNSVDADQSALGAGNILGQDPRFVAAPGPGPDGAWGTLDDDFSGLVLQQDSPAIDRGVTQYIAADGEHVPPTPLTGFTGAAPDLGWREVGNPIFPTPTAAGAPSPTLAATATPSRLPTSAATAGLPPPSTGTQVTSTGAPGTGTPAITGTAPSGTPPTSTPRSGTPPTEAITPTATATGTPNATEQAQLTIQGVSPGTARPGTTLTLRVGGKGFQNGATAALEGASGTPPDVIGVQVLSSSELNLTIQVPENVSGTDRWDLRVTNPDGSSAAMRDALIIR